MAKSRSALIAKVVEDAAQMDRTLELRLRMKRGQSGPKAAYDKRQRN
jgi:hypothetical protein